MIYVPRDQCIQAARENNIVFRFQCSVASSKNERTRLNKRISYDRNPVQMHRVSAAEERNMLKRRIVMREF